MHRSNSMIETIKSIILDFQEVHLDTGVPRRLPIETIHGKATVCIGVRRSGKSTYMFQMIRKLLENGINRENILYLNFFDDRLHNLQQDGIGLVTEAYYSLYPEKKNTETVYCFFDGIQVVSGWESFVDRLIRMEKCEVCLTGSSAQMLSKEIATQMRGRALSWELFPFSFPEFLDYKGIESSGPMSTKSRLFVQKAFDEYWKTGGFPEVAGLSLNLRIKTHQEYFHTILFRDIVERHDVSHPKAISDLAHRLVDNTASLYSINSLTGYLKSLGTQGPQIGGVGLPGMVRRRLFSFHHADIRCIPGAQQHQPEEDILHRSRIGRISVVRDSRQFRTSLRESGVHGAPASLS